VNPQVCRRSSSSRAKHEARLPQCLPQVYPASFPLQAASPSLATTSSRPLAAPHAAHIKSDLNLDDRCALPTDVDPAAGALAPSARDSARALRDESAQGGSRESGQDLREGGGGGTQLTPARVPLAAHTTSEKQRQVLISEGGTGLLMTCKSHAPGLLLTGGRTVARTERSGEEREAMGDLEV
jgi:hypothetical protein